MFEGPKKVLRENHEFSPWQSIGDMMTVLLLVFILFLMVTALKSLKDKELLKKNINDFFEKKKKVISELKKMQNDLAGKGILVCLNENSGTISIPAPSLFKEGEYIPNLESNRESSLKDSCPKIHGWQGPSQKFSPTGRKNIPLLDIFLKKYFGVVWNDKFKNDISGIEIVGYTDSTPISRRNEANNTCLNIYSKYDLIFGDPIYYRKVSENSLKVIKNVKAGVREFVNKGTDLSGFRREKLGNICLSWKRSQMIYNFAWNRIQDNSLWRLEDLKRKKWIKYLETKVTTNGRGSTHPIKTKDGKEDKPLSRRVEFQLKVDDRKSIQKILKEH